MTDGKHETPEHVVVIASGGLDSTTLAYMLHAKGSRVALLSFDYGQRHRRELVYAVEAARTLNVPHDQVDLRGLRWLLAPSALTDPEIAVPDGHYTADSMRATVVPNRNALMLEIAVAFAIAHHCDAVAFGAHAGDHAIYPDCRQEFIEAFSRSTHLANEGLLPTSFRVLTPFLSEDKAAIVTIGAKHGVPFDRTWSCYRGEALHCGTCGTCTERREAFTKAGVADPTEYQAG
jgi:7-cyano-7-deazaguanine synthase